MTLPQSALALHKFGGSSLADPKCYQRVANLLLSHSNQADLVVVSAAGKTTNKLIKLHQLAQDSQDYALLLQQLAQYQLNLIAQLLEQPQALTQLLNAELGQLQSWLESPTDNATKIVACGEVWSSRLLSALLNQQGRSSIAFDARDFMIAQGEVTPIVDEALSTQNLTQLSEPHFGAQRVTIIIDDRNVAVFTNQVFG